ncbi:MAG: leucine-rich repeat domain-containing protein [Lachnospiraceae bacterium]|nr:leucine-rich repeat domain-containing protein [Lachnospiraceae bacterium]
MNRLVKIKLPKPRIAYALSAALIISMSPVPAFASGSLDTSTSDNVQNSIQVNTVTGGTIGTTTGGSVTTGGVVSPVNTPSPVPPETPPAGGNQWIPGPSNSPQATATPAPPASDDNQPGTTTAPGTTPPDTTTGGAVIPGTTPPDTTTGGAVTPSQPPAPSTPPSPAPLAVGTKFTAGKYIYRVTGINTVALKGFAKGVSLSTVTAQNQVKYKNVVYNVTKIGDNAFKGQAGIQKAIIRKNITDVSLKSFYNCKNLSKVTIRTGVKIIRKQAFMGCSKLKTVNITSPSLSQVKKNAFKNIKKGAVINVVNKQARLTVKAAIPSNVKVNQM